MYSHAVSLLTAEHGGDHPDIARAYNNIASVYITLEQYDRALEMCRKSLAMFKATQGDGHPDIARGYNNMGYVYDQKCEFDRALEMYHRSLQIFVATLGEHHPTVATCYNNMGNVCLSRREYGKAEALYQRSLDIWNLRQDTAQAAALQLAVDEMHRMNSRRRLPHPDSKGRKAGCAVM
jgi:tetratricopeptide (TPR) repeat protein